MRMIDWPQRVGDMSLIGGPTSTASGANVLADGSEQTFANADYILSFEVSIPASQGTTSRREFGWLLSSQGGSNAFRYLYHDGNKPRASEYGLMPLTGFSSGAGWSLERTDEQSFGVIKLADSASEGDTIIRLQDDLWGHKIDVGDAIGFTSIFCIHWVTRVVARGLYQITPPLRTNLNIDRNFAHLQPRLAVRHTQAAMGYGTFNPAYASDRSAQFIEVTHGDAITYFGA